MIALTAHGYVPPMQLTLATIRPRFTPTAIDRWRMLDERVRAAWARGEPDDVVDAMRTELDADTCRVLGNLKRSFDEGAREDARADAECVTPQGALARAVSDGARRLVSQDDVSARLARAAFGMEAA